MQLSIKKRYILVETRDIFDVLCIFFFFSKINKSTSSFLYRVSRPPLSFAPLIARRVMIQDRVRVTITRVCTVITRLVPGARLLKRPVVRLHQK